MFDLAQRYGEGPIPLKMIAERQGISEHYLEQLMGSLRKARLVVSVRGAQGGYKLTENPRNITVGDVIRALEGPILTVHGTEDDTESPAGDSLEQLTLVNVWKRLADEVSQVLDSVSLADLCDEVARMRAQNDSFMYHI